MALWPLSTPRPSQMEPCDPIPQSLRAPGPAPVRNERSRGQRIHPSITQSERTARGLGEDVPRHLLYGRRLVGVPEDDRS